MNYKCHHLTFELHILLSILGKVSRQTLEQRLQNHESNLSSLQYWILRMLQHEGACTMSELSRKVMLDPSTLVPTIDNLERRAFIVRERDPNDRRRLPLSLTMQGLTVIESIPLLDDDHPIIHSLDKLGEEPAEQMVELLRKLVMNLPDGEHLLEQAQSRMKPIIAKNEETHASN